LLSLSHPSILSITIVTINFTHYRDNNNTKGNDGKTGKKQGNQFPHRKKLVQEPEGNEENTQIQTPTK
jgi:hypothetical protein